MRVYNNEILKDIDHFSDYYKLRVFLSGYKKCGAWVSCDIKCSTEPLSHEEIAPLLELKEKHNLNFKDIMTLYISYWNGQFKPYKNEYGILIPSLEKEFLKFRKENVYSDKYFWDDRVGEKNFQQLILSDDVNVYEFIKKYNLTELDFLILAKTQIHGFVSQYRLGESDNLVPDLDSTLIAALGDEKVKTLKRVAKSKCKDLGDYPRI